MGSEVLISAIIPTFNRQDVVCRAIDSVLRQTYANLEIIVVDDGSTDNTFSRLATYGSKIRIITQSNAGPSAARNRGALAARGDLVSFLDSDDEWLPTKIERQVALLHKAGPSVPGCICDAVLQFKTRSPITSFRNSLLKTSVQEGLWLNAPQVLMHRFLLFNQTVVIRREVFEKIGGFDESLRYLEDYDLALRLSLLGPIAFINDPLVIYYAGTDNSLTEEALRREICIRENIAKIRQRVRDVVKTNREYVGLETAASRSVRLARLALWVSRLRQKHIPGGELTSRLLDRLGRYMGAMADRSPWFEGMKAVPIPNQIGQQKMGIVRARGVCGERDHV